jgi:predicted Zn-dependent protease
MVAISDSVIKATALHEAGHALGISAHSGNPEDIMYPSQDGSTYSEPTLSERDKKTILLLYTAKLPADEPYVPTITISH